MTYLDRLAQLSNDAFSALWNAAGTTKDVVAQVVARVGHVPRWAVVARGVALRKAGADITRDFRMKMVSLMEAP